MNPNANTMAWRRTKTPTNSRRQPSLIIHTSKFSFHVISLQGSSVTSPDMSIRERGGHLDRSLPDRELADEGLRSSFSLRSNFSIVYTGASEKPVGSYGEWRVATSVNENSRCPATQHLLRRLTMREEQRSKE